MPCATLTHLIEVVGTTCAWRAGDGIEKQSPDRATVAASPAMRHVQLLHRSLECIQRLESSNGALWDQLANPDALDEVSTPQCSEMVAAVHRACQAANKGGHNPGAAHVSATTATRLGQSCRGGAVLIALRADGVPQA